MSIVFWPLFTSICFNLKNRKPMLPALHFFIPSVLQIVKETIGVGVNEKAVLRRDWKQQKIWICRIGKFLFSERKDWWLVWMQRW